MEFPLLVVYTLHQYSFLATDYFSRIVETVVSDGRRMTSVAQKIHFLVQKSFEPGIGLVIFVHLSSLPVAHLGDAPGRRLVVTGDSARIQDETTERSAWFLNVLGV